MEFGCSDSSTLAIVLEKTDVVRGSNLASLRFSPDGTKILCLAKDTPSMGFLISLFGQHVSANYRDYG